MRIDASPRFDEERRLFVLRFTCENCAQFDDGAASCAHGYPVEDHRDERYAASGVDIVFCKDFQLL